MISCVRSLVFVTQQGQLLRVLAGVAEVGEDRHRIVRVLFLHHREIDGLAVQTRRRAGLQPTDRQRQFAQPCGERNRRGSPMRPPV